MTDNSESSRKYGIDPIFVGQHLPYLTEFNQESIERYTDAITRLIFNYKLNSPERLSFLKDCVQKSIPKSYPKDFVEIVEEIFLELGESL